MYPFPQSFPYPRKSKPVCLCSQVYMQCLITLTTSHTHLTPKLQRGHTPRFTPTPFSLKVSLVTAHHTCAWNSAPKFQPYGPQGLGG